MQDPEAQSHWAGLTNEFLDRLSQLVVRLPLALDMLGIPANSAALAAFTSEMQKRIAGLRYLGSNRMGICLARKGDQVEIAAILAAADGSKMQLHIETTMHILGTRLARQDLRLSAAHLRAVCDVLAGTLTKEDE